VAWTAETATVSWVVGVEPLSFELTPAERVMVGVNAGCQPADDADGVASEYAGSEPLFVLSPVSALPRRAALLLGFGPVVVAAPALVGELTASGFCAGAPSWSLRHACLRHDAATFVCAV
jgi:hypothetical protein